MRSAQLNVFAFDLISHMHGWDLLKDFAPPQIPERNMLIAIFARALADALPHDGLSESSDVKKNRREARRWFKAGRKTSWCSFTFIQLTDFLFDNAEEIRQVTHELLDGARPVPPRARHSDNSLPTGK